MKLKAPPFFFAAFIISIWMGAQRCNRSALKCSASGIDSVSYWDGGAVAVGCGAAKDGVWLEPVGTLIGLMLFTNSSWFHHSFHHTNKTPATTISHSKSRIEKRSMGMQLGVGD